MPRTCTICKHPQREGMDAALVAAEPLRSIAERFGTSATALHRHKVDHVSRALVRAAEARELAHDGKLLDQVKGLIARAQSILSKAEARGDHRTALAAIREVRGTLELLGKITGELTPALSEQPRVPLFNLPPGSHVAVRLDIESNIGS